MTIQEFEEKICEIYDSLPKDLQDKFSVSIEEKPCEYSYQGPNRLIFGYWNNLTPSNIVICYWGFKLHGDFSEQHIRNVMNHELEHRFCGLNHREHKS